MTSTRLSPFGFPAVTPRIALFLFLLLFAFAPGCAISGGREPAPAVEGPVCAGYEIRVHLMEPPQADADGFHVHLRFEVASVAPVLQNALVQELQQRTVYELADGRREVREVSLVEAFRVVPSGEASGVYLYTLAPGQRDHHFRAGLERISGDVVGITIERRVLAYLASVNGADYTSHGFAHLPRNENGSVVTNIPQTFNENYQQAHATRGEVCNSHLGGAVLYRLRYRLQRDGGRDAQFSLDCSPAGSDAPTFFVVTR